MVIECDKVTYRRSAGVPGSVFFSFSECAY